MTPEAERDRVLGHYMAQIGRVENVLGHIMRLLLGIERPFAMEAILSILQNRQKEELLSSLAAAQLGEATRKRVDALLSRFHKANTKRNRIVHGAWVHHVVAGGPTQWLRVYSPTDPDLARRMYRLDDADVRETFNFTLPQIESAARHVATLADDLSEMFRDLRPLLERPSPPPPDTTG